MTLDLVGIVENGGTRGRNVPAAAGREIRLPKGELLTIHLDVVYATGAPVELATKTVTLTVRRTPGGEKLVQAVAAGLGRGICTITVPATSTQAKDTGTYLYDVWIDFGQGQIERIVPLRPFVLLPSMLASA